MTPKLQELRLKELTKGLDVIKKHIQAGNLGTACERLYATYSELKVISRRRKTANDLDDTTLGRRDCGHLYNL
jgi:hypothetical protein